MGEYKMRRDNLISPWGVGAIVPFPHDESLMVGGLDKWFDDEHFIDDFLITDERLTKKIYCPQYMTEDNNKMAGILIYTASGDAEGSLGGLVRQGLPGKLEEIIKHAISEARWCAADPVCIQSPGQGQDGCNLAACHNCALLPETSCENKNKLLDRGLMIGTLNDESLGFFNNKAYGYYIDD